MTIEAATVQFLASYREMTKEERGTPEIEARLADIKQIIEHSLITNPFFALGYGIRIGEVTSDSNWINTLVVQVKQNFPQYTPSEQADLIPMLSKYQ